MSVLNHGGMRADDRHGAPAEGEAMPDDRPVRSPGIAPTRAQDQQLGVGRLIGNERRKARSSIPGVV